MGAPHPGIWLKQCFSQEQVISGKLSHTEMKRAASPSVMFRGRMKFQLWSFVLTALKEEGSKQLDSKARFNTVSKADLNGLEINSGHEF